MTHHPFGDAAQQGTLYASATVAADHDEVRWPISSSLHDLVGGHPCNDELERRRLQRQTLTEAFQQPLSVLLGLINQFIWRNAGVGAIARRRVDGVDKCYVSAKRTCKLYTYVGGMRGDRLTIDCNKNSRKPIVISRVEPERMGTGCP